jgi:hypothetical protein
MPKPIRFADTGLPNVERERFATSGGRSGVGRTTIIIHCPFCRSEVTAYLWSLAGGGKRCDCGALFSGYGLAYRWKPVATERTVQDHVDRSRS